MASAVRGGGVFFWFTQRYEEDANQASENRPGHRMLGEPLPTTFRGGKKAYT